MSPLWVPGFGLAQPLLSLVPREEPADWRFLSIMNKINFLNGNQNDVFKQMGTKSTKIDKRGKKFKKLSGKVGIHRKGTKLCRVWLGHLFKDIDSLLEEGGDGR